MRRRAGLALLAVAIPALGRATGWNDPVLQFFRMIELDAESRVREALAAGQDPNGRNAEGQLPLHWALLQGSGKAARALLADARLDLEALNAKGESALMLAALRGRVDWLKELVRRGAQVEPQRGDKVWTALHYACSGPELAASAWLLEQGARVNARSPNGSTPLMLALGYGSPDHAPLLLARGADRSLRNDLGLDALEFARRGGRLELARRLGLADAVSAKP